MRHVPGLLLKLLLEAVYWVDYQGPAEQTEGDYGAGDRCSSSSGPAQGWTLVLLNWTHCLGPSSRDRASGPGKGNEGSVCPAQNEKETLNPLIPEVSLGALGKAYFP